MIRPGEPCSWSRRQCRYSDRCCCGKSSILTFDGSEQKMIWVVTIGTFLAPVAVCIPLYYAFAPGEPGIVRRLSQLAETPGTEQREAFAEKQKERVQEALASVGKLVPGGTASRAELMIIRAGYRNPNVILTIRGL